MRDEMDARMWIEHHGGLSELVDRIGSQLRLALKTLHALEWDAPWRGKPKRRA
jgi:hypothetical protein